MGFSTPKTFQRYSSAIPALFQRYSSAIPALFQRYSSAIPALFQRYSNAISPQLSFIFLRKSTRAPAAREPRKFLPRRGGCLAPCARGKPPSDPDGRRLEGVTK
jgi:hypothetical protein